MDRKPSWIAGIIWWGNCLAAGYVLGLKYGKPWIGLAIGGGAGVFPSIFAASPMVGGRGGCLPAPVGVVFGIAMAIGGVVREGCAWGVAGISALFLAATGLAGLVAVRMRRMELAFERAVREKDLVTIITHWSRVRGTSAALECLSASPESAALIEARYDAVPQEFERMKMVSLMAALRRPEARAFLKKLVEGQAANWGVALGGLIILGDREDLPLIFSHLRIDDEEQTRAAIDLAVKHGARDLLEKVDLKEDRDLREYRDAALRGKMGS